MAREDRFANSFEPLTLLRWIQAIAALSLCALAVVPTRVIAAGPSVCLIKRFFGVECYGCGMTRALSALLHGEWRAALAYNRGVMFVFMLLALTVFSAVWLPSRTKR
jgi:hypothetical protein